MKILQGNIHKIPHAMGWKRAKVWKKTNQWFYCPSCETLVYFWGFKCRYDWNSPPKCSTCPDRLKKAPDRICGDAKKIIPHFHTRRAPREGKTWYQDVYLRSALWRAIRERVLVRDGHTCQKCKRGADIVHHKSYDPDVMHGGNDAMLVALCFDCHRLIEFDGDRKTTLQEANARLER